MGAAAGRRRAWSLLPAALLAVVSLLALTAPPPAAGAGLNNEEVMILLRELYDGDLRGTLRDKLEAARNPEHPSAVVVAVTVTWAFIDFFENWRCSLERQGLRTR